MNKYDENDIACLKTMGVDTIRLICTFDLLSDMPYGSGKIHDTILEKLDQVCDWVEKYQIYLIICNCYNHVVDSPEHADDYGLLKAQLECVWSQLSQRYKNRSEYIIYEITNEPSNKDAGKWYTIQQDIINLIRNNDTKHSIVVSCVNWSNITELTQLKPYKDPNLIYTFHFYEPQIFTHQGAEWIADAADLAEIPFPYDKNRIPEIKDTGVKWYIENVYTTEGTVNHINSRIKKVASWAKKNKVKVFCGEIGAKAWINTKDRFAWINATVAALNKNGIPYCTWGIDNTDGFLKTEHPSQFFPDDIDYDALTAYGFNMPDAALVQEMNPSLKQFPQTPYIVYDGLCGKGTRGDMNGRLQTSKDDDVHEYCLKASYPAQDMNCKLYLPDIILSKFAQFEQSLVISFSAKFTDKSQEFTFILQDSDGGEAELPYENLYTVKASDYPLNKWVKIEIPVSNFLNGKGVWSNKEQKYFDTPGEFTWSRFESIFLNFNDMGKNKKGDIYIDDVVIKRN